MITLLKQLGGPWEQVRGYLESDLEHIQEAINSNWDNVFGPSDHSNLQPGAVLGDSTIETVYVSNTGPNNEPKWARINLANGVTGRLAFEHLPVITKSTLLGRRSSVDGEPEEIQLGTNLAMSGTTLNASGSGDVSGPASSVDSEVALFSGTTGKTLKRATGSGIVNVASGVYNTVTIPSDSVQFLNGSATPVFSKPTTKITGITTNTNAIAGDIGEYVESVLAVGSEVTLSDSTAKTVTSISLTAGDWDVTGVVDFDLNSTTVTEFWAGSSTTTNTLGGQDSWTQFHETATSFTDVLIHSIPTQRYLLSGTTTIYLIAEVAFSAGTAKAYGTIRARRMR